LVLIEQVVRQVPDTKRTAAWALYAVQQGHGQALARPVVRGDIPAEQRDAVVTEALADLVDGLLLWVLASQGLATVTVNWSGPWQVLLVGRDGSRSPWPFAEAAAAVAADPAQMPSLVAELQRLGVDLDVPIAEDEESVALRSAAAAALPVVLPRPRIVSVRRRQAFDTVLYDDGLLLHPAPRQANGFGAQMRGTVLHTRGRVSGARLERLVKEVDGEPAAWAKRAGPPTWWIPYTELATARWRSKIFGDDRVELTWHDGRRLSLVTTSLTAQVGDVRQVLSRAVGSA
jgi:hypothetical protein